MLNLDELAEKLLESKKNTPKTCFVGFDGFTDEISRAVDKRSDGNKFSYIPTIKEFAKRVANASNKSCNIELIYQQKKLGGNAPILTNALLKTGHCITFAGTIGLPGKIETIFQPMAELCKKTISLGPSSYSDAVEFQDGKVIFGKLSSLSTVNYKNLISQINEKDLIKTLEHTDLFASVNWTMLPEMTKLWQDLLQKIVPSFSSPEKKRYLFVDLADPAKRSDQDLKEALETLLSFSTSYKVILALNAAEAQRLTQILPIPFKQSSENLSSLAKHLHENIPLSEIVIHKAETASSSSKQGTYNVNFPLCKKPKLTTGAGDNFNAGYCKGVLQNFKPEESLALGMASGGFYVRHAKSPSLEELASFLMNSQ